MTDVEKFLERASGLFPVRDLIIVPSAASRSAAFIEAANEAAKRNLCVIFRSVDHSAFVGDSLAVFRIAHANLHRELAGTDWSAVHGWEHLDKYDNADEIKGRIGARIRA